MVVIRPERSHGPQMDATDARQARRAPGAFLMLAVSTVVGVIAVAIVWAFFAGPLHHPTSPPQVSSPQQAAAFHVGTPNARMAAPGEPR